MKKLALVALLLLGGCFTPPPRYEPEAERVFTDGATRYKVTREWTSDGPGEWLLWREEGLTWRLVASKPGP